MLQFFQNYTPCSRDYMVHIANGSLSKVASTGFVVISKDLTLDFVLLVPNLDCNFLSISKLTQEKNYVTKFFPNHRIFQDLNFGKTIDNAKVCWGLYIFKVTDYIKRQPQLTVGEKQSLFVFSSNKDSDVMLWHYRLVHPSFLYLRKLFSSLFTKSSDGF